MRKIHKIANIGLIFILVGVVLWDDLSYPSDISCIRVPVDIKDGRKEETLSAIGREALEGRHKEGFTKVSTMDSESLKKTNITYTTIKQHRKELFEYFIKRTKKGCYWNNPIEIEFKLRKKVSLFFLLSKGTKKNVKVYIKEDGKVYDKILQKRIDKPIMLIRKAQVQLKKDRKISKSHVNPKNIVILDHGRALSLFNFIIQELRELEKGERYKDVVSKYLKISEEGFYKMLSEGEARISIAFRNKNKRQKSMQKLFLRKYLSGLGYLINDGGEVEFGHYVVDKSKVNNLREWSFIEIHSHPLKGDKFTSKVLDASRIDNVLLRSIRTCSSVIFARFSNNELRGRIYVLDEKGNVISQDIALVRQKGKVNLTRKKARVYEINKEAYVGKRTRRTRTQRKIHSSDI